MIPHVTEYGVLPPGRHPATLNEIEQRFAVNDHRRGLWQGLLRYVAWVKELGFFHRIYIGGGFVSDSEAPKDIDVGIIAHTRVPRDERILMAGSPDYTMEHFGIQAFPSSMFLMVFESMRDGEADRRGCPRGTKKGVLMVDL